MSANKPYSQEILDLFIGDIVLRNVIAYSTPDRFLQDRRGLTLDSIDESVGFRDVKRVGELQEEPILIDKGESFELLIADAQAQAFRFLSICKYIEVSVVIQDLNMHNMLQEKIARDFKEGSDSAQVLVQEMEANTVATAYKIGSFVASVFSAK